MLAQMSHLQQIVQTNQQFDTVPPFQSILQDDVGLSIRQWNLPSSGSTLTLANVLLESQYGSDQRLVHTCMNHTWHHVFGFNTSLRMYVPQVGNIFGKLLSWVSVLYCLVRGEDDYILVFEWLTLPAGMLGVMMLASESRLLPGALPPRNLTTSSAIADVMLPPWTVLKVRPAPIWFACTIMEDLSLLLNLNLGLSLSIYITYMLQTSSRFLRFLYIFAKLSSFPACYATRLVLLVQTASILFVLPTLTWAWKDNWLQSCILPLLYRKKDFTINLIAWCRSSKSCS